MPPLNYRHLEYFHAVAHEGGVTAAADVLHVSQPSISALGRRSPSRPSRPTIRPSTPARPPLRPSTAPSPSRSRPLPPLPSRARRRGTSLDGW
ncbi:MAG: LysR family transcriptional regulator [Gemmatimonadota bacterium]